MPDNRAAPDLGIEELSEVSEEVSEVRRGGGEGAVKSDCLLCSA